VTSNNVSDDGLPAIDELDLVKPDAGLYESEFSHFAPASAGAVWI
jgi:hypothetical protein